MHRLPLFLVVAIGATGCTERNPAYCTDSSTCPDGLVCDVPIRTCVEPTPDADDRCTLDDDCESGVCRPDGACAAPEAILYVSADGPSAGDCGPTTPCDLFHARSLASTERSTIRLANGQYVLSSDFVVTSPLASLSIVGGRGAVIRRAAAGPAFEVRDGSALTIHGLTLNKGIRCSSFAQLHVARVSFDNAENEALPWIGLSECTSATIVEAELIDSTSDGIDASGTPVEITASRIEGSAGNGIRAQGGQVAVHRSVIDKNRLHGVLAMSGSLSIHRSHVFENHSGGISATSGTFDITNNFIYRNGNAVDARFGGLHLDTFTSGNRVHHNTIVRNDCDVVATPVLAGGIYCRGGVGRNNLISNNFRGNADGTNAQVGGTCDLAGSRINSDDAMWRFVSPTDVPFDLHLANRASPAVDVGIALPEPLTEDIDGQPRSDGEPDVGADELDR
ncbi:MAG: right-handed parallel beta-helix repeat-containing protein [Kofleriaceae bacterium]